MSKLGECRGAGDIGDDQFVSSAGGCCGGGGRNRGVSRFMEVLSSMPIGVKLPIGRESLSATGSSGVSKWCKPSSFDVARSPSSAAASEGMTMPLTGHDFVWRSSKKSLRDAGRPMSKPTKVFLTTRGAGKVVASRSIDQAVGYSKSGRPEPLMQCVLVWCFGNGKSYLSSWPVMLDESDDFRNNSSEGSRDLRESAMPCASLGILPADVLRDCAPLQLKFLPNHLPFRGVAGMIAGTMLGKRIRSTNGGGTN